MRTAKTHISLSIEHDASMNVKTDRKLESYTAPNSNQARRHWHQKLKNMRSLLIPQSFPSNPGAHSQSKSPNRSWQVAPFLHVVGSRHSLVSEINTCIFSFNKPLTSKLQRITSNKHIECVFRINSWLTCSTVFSFKSRCTFTGKVTK